MEACGEVPPGRRVKMPEERVSVSRAPWLALGLVDCRQTLSTPLPNAKRLRNRHPGLAGSEAPHNPVSSSPRLLVPQPFSPTSPVMMADPMSSGVKKLGCKTCQKVFSKAEHLRVSFPCSLVCSAKIRFVEKQALI